MTWWSIFPLPTGLPHNPLLGRAMTRAMKRRLFSGIQPTGNIHIGNYLGAIRHWVALQAHFDNLFCLVDLHAITIPQEPSVLKSKIRELAALLMAAGIDLQQSTVFVQSHIGAHTEMAWMLNCLIPMGWMKRMTQFKQKSRSQRDLVSVGLFDYPALMAADILLYETDFVPVGEDQRQHVELTRDIARRFNSIYGDTFKLPEPIIAERGARIMGLDDPTQKMSKTTTKPGHAIHLLDPPDAIRAKVMGATTDSLREIRFDEKRPGIHNLLVLYELFTGIDRAGIEARFEGKGYSDLKRELAGIIIEALAPLQARYRELTDEPGFLDSVLKGGASKVRPRAEKTLSVVKDKIGLG
jgi:tryptophanyl-tRNA synthetase